jgi:hypothetical protein
MFRIWRVPVFYLRFDGWFLPPRRGKARMGVLFTCGTILGRHPELAATQTRLVENDMLKMTPML